MNKQQDIGRKRRRRRFHVRNKLGVTTQHPRLSVSRSGQNIGCQIIDDVQGKTIASASTQDKELRAQVKYGGNCAAASVVGKTIAEKALAAGIKQVRFDRGHCKFHGRVAALADAAREAGLSF